MKMSVKSGNVNKNQKFQQPPPWIYKITLKFIKEKNKSIDKYQNKVQSKSAAQMIQIIQ